MKKALCLSVIWLLFGIGLSFGQLSYGVKAGVNLYRLSVGNNLTSFTTDAKAGFTGGAASRLNG